MPAESQEIFSVIGRVLLGGLFVVGGIQHFFTLPGITQALAARGVPAARLVLLFGSVFQILAGLALIFGFYPMWAALALVVFTLVASVLLANFWSMDGSARANAITTWQTNLAIIGGLLVAAARPL